MLTIKRVFAVVVGLVLFTMGTYETLDPDMWWHLRTGELIWDSGIPREDPFSLTRLGVEWVTHEWLTEAVMWLAVATGGLVALSVLFACLSAAAFWLVFRCSAGQPYLAGAVTLVAAFAASPSFGARPQVMNMLFMAMFVFVVERVREGRYAPRILLWLPLLTVAWVNFHSGYLLGVVVLLTYAAGELAEIVVPSPAARAADAPGGDATRVRWLVGVAVACFVAALANPNGWHLWTYPFGTLGSDLMQQNIVEWTSPDFHLPMYWPFAAMLFVGVASWAVAPRRPPWTDVLLFLGTAAAGLMSRRHIALFAIVATPVVARSLYDNLRATHVYRLVHDAPDEPVGGVKRVLNAAILGVAVLGVLSWTGPKLAANEATIATEYPVAAVDFIEREGLADAPVYNTYIWGGYLVWRGIRPFVDGRADVYGDFLGEYLKTFRLTPQWREPLEAFDVAYVLIERDNSLATLLVASDEWREIYADDVARVLARVDPATTESR